MIVWTPQSSQRVQERAIRWLAKHDIDHLDVYLVEILRDKGRYGVARVHRYKQNEDGRRFIDVKTGDIAVQRVKTIKLRSGEYDELESKNDS